MYLDLDNYKEHLIFLSNTLTYIVFHKYHPL
nr:MAG TPA: hypothetical protein [Caudoviricetes sp.]